MPNQSARAGFGSCQGERLNGVWSAQVPKLSDAAATPAEDHPWRSEQTGGSHSGIMADNPMKLILRSLFAELLHQGTISACDSHGCSANPTPVLSPRAGLTGVATGAKQWSGAGLPHARELAAALLLFRFR